MEIATYRPQPAKYPGGAVARFTETASPTSGLAAQGSREQRVYYCAVQTHAPIESGVAASSPTAGRRHCYANRASVIVATSALAFVLLSYKHWRRRCAAHFWQA